MLDVYSLVNPDSIIGCEYVLFDKDNFVFVLLDSSIFSYEQANSLDNLQKDLIADVDASYKMILSLDITEYIGKIKETISNKLNTTEFSIGYSNINSSIDLAIGVNENYREINLFSGELYSEIYHAFLEIKNMVNKAMYELKIL
ncbi:MAG: hypothetical protein EPN82_14390 [Bacteroidetes bacterium]|nr:MAG: hypothetical protein EPN82_14390 [Bacteroidota bacterium]